MTIGSMNIITRVSALITVFVVTIGSISCSRRPAHFAQVEDTARRDVAKVVEAKEGSMEREHAVLAIRVREHALRSNGHEAEADLYYTTAHNLLVDSFNIIQERTAAEVSN